jgi:transcriptional regulator with XRE-family HTH domain
VLRQNATPLDKPVIVGNLVIVMVTRIAAFGPILRELRRASGMTLRELADRCGTNHTHLSRLERDDDRVPSRGLLERLARELGPEAGARLAAAAGQVTPTAERALALFPHALAEPALSTRSVPALRRIEAASLADSLLQRVPMRGIERDRVNPSILCRTLGLRPLVQSGEVGPAAVFEGDTVTICDPGEPGDAAALPRVRFLLAHVAGHTLIGRRSCSFPRMGDDEVQAFDLAGQLLCARPLLERALTFISPGLDKDARNPWASRSGDVVTAVAERLSVPGWVALRRLADEALLDDEALYFSLGDQL